MKEHTVRAYSFAELSESAKDKVREYWLRCAEGYDWADDALGSLKCFAEHFGAKLTDWNIDWDCAGRSDATFSSPDMEEEELARLVGELKTDGSCQFTGYCADDACNDGAVKSFKEGERDLNTILQAGFETWLASCVSDFEYQRSKEAVDDSIAANWGDWEFTENGEKFKG